jgi:uncharacterized phage-associated protein
MLDKDTYVSPKSIASWFINAADREAGEGITHLKVQKLVYYAQAWFLANFDRPLFEEELEAWTHGPVVPSLYQKYRGTGFEALDIEVKPRLPDEIVPFLERVASEYGQYSAKKLEQITHEEDPWRVTRDGLPLEARCKKPIDRLLIRNFYAGRLGKKETQTLSN